MIPSPFTADLARDHRSALVARSSRHPARSPRRRGAVAALATIVALARSVRTRPAAPACAAC
ncbi:MAG TPA: hypothetical protein VM242_01330 [Acidimicrobiales bacterium]|jgi:hypothetical protein|nr:hypothetical protein [Acidimicrobiales bacterium]